MKRPNVNDDKFSNSSNAFLITQYSKELDKYIDYLQSLPKEVEKKYPKCELFENEECRYQKRVCTTKAFCTSKENN